MRQDLALRRMNRLVDDFFNNRFTPVLGTLQGQVYINTNIVDMGETYEITAELPGVKKEDIQIEVDSKNITIAVESKKEDSTEDKRYLMREIISGKSSRTFTFGDILDSENAKVEYVDGLLKLIVPKKNFAGKKLLKVD